MSDVGEADVTFKRRFAEISAEQLQIILDSKDFANTKRSTNQAVKIFRDYLQGKALSTDFERFDNLLVNFMQKPGVKLENYIKSRP